MEEAWELADDPTEAADEAAELTTEEAPEAPLTATPLTNGMPEKMVEDAVVVTKVLPPEVTVLTRACVLTAVVTVEVAPLPDC
jgi:hypothetical protein